MKKKSQLYGLNAFLYALAIGIILIVGTVGIAKEFQASSGSGLYRFQAITATKNAESLKKFLDSERGAVLDKSLFITGAFGGYSSYVDLVNAGNCTFVGCGNGCPSGFSCVNDPASTNYGWCINSTGALKLPNPCYPAIVNDTDPSPTNNTRCCGVKDTNISFFGEKKLPYLRRYISGVTMTCVPNESKVQSVIIDFASKIFGAPDNNIIAGLTMASREKVDFNYILEIKKIWEGIIETNWYPVGISKIVLDLPPGSANPAVTYAFDPYSHIISKTKFFSLYAESKQFVKDNELDTYLKSSAYSPLPLYADEDYPIVRYFNKTTIFYDYGNPASIAEKPFVALVNYTLRNYPTTPNTCPSSSTILSSLGSLASNYTLDCIAYSKRDPVDGKLKVVSYGGGCNADATLNGTAIKCVMNYAINNINIAFNLTLPATKGAPASGSHHTSTLNWKYEFFTFNLTYKGQTARSLLDYNTSTMPPANASPAVNPSSRPGPRNCSEPACDTTHERYCEQPIGGACAGDANCCGSGDVYPGPGLYCCSAADAYVPTFKNKCQTASCTGQLNLTYTGTPMRTYPITFKVGGLCNGCTSKTATLTGSCLSGSPVTTGTFSSAGSVTQSITLTQSGTRTVTAAVAGFASVNININIADCGGNGQTCCSGSVCSSGYTCNASNKCTPCGTVGIVCCAGGLACGVAATPPAYWECGGGYVCCNRTNTRCYACGSYGQPCCNSAPGPWVNYCSETGTTCSSGTCTCNTAGGYYRDTSTGTCKLCSTCPTGYCNSAKTACGGARCSAYIETCCRCTACWGTWTGYDRKCVGPADTVPTSHSYGCASGCACAWDCCSVGVTCVQNDSCTTTTGWTQYGSC